MVTAPQRPTERRSLRSEQGSFRRRAAAALTHPLTLAALGALLINDVALKRAWPDAWAMGKLSDLAWMIFAPPLLAYALSFFLGRSAFGERAGFGIAYLGLPLLYAAFNTFEAAHNAVLRGLALVGGSYPGSPLDATDSAVIPFAMAAALWAWRRPPANPHAVRARLALLTMAVAALATVATSQSPPIEGVTNVRADGEGKVSAFVRGGWGRSGYYESRDGGLTWTLGGWGSSIPDEPPVRAQTPSGAYYAIAGSDVVRTGDGGREIVYSAAYLEQHPNLWAQARHTREHGSRILTSAPRAIAYDNASGNVVLAMGTQGVVVGALDGTWRKIAIGRFGPTDFSFTNKLRSLLDRPFLWLAFSLAVSFICLGMAPALLERHRGTDEYGISLCLMAVPSVICSFIILTAGLYPTDEITGYDGPEIGPNFWKASIGFVALIIAVSGIGANHPNWRQALAGIAAMAGMLLLVLLAFMLWLQVNLQLRFADLFALLFVGLAALALHSYLARSARGLAQPESAPPE